LIGVVLLVALGGKFGNSLDSLLYLTVPLMVLVGSITMIISPDTKAQIVQGVPKPDNLETWIDLYASADPVPNGPTMTPVAGVPASIRIWNRDSFFADHTTYWENYDGFVLRVARACADTAKTAWAAMLPARFDAIDARSSWRVGLLRLSRTLNLVIWL